MQLLLDKGAKVNARGGEYGNALLAASFEGHRETVQLLLHNGADVHSKDCHGWEASMIAVANGHSQVADLLSKCNKGTAIGTSVTLSPAALVHAASPSGIVIHKDRLTVTTGRSLVDVFEASFWLIQCSQNMPHTTNSQRGARSGQITPCYLTCKLSTSKSSPSNAVQQGAFQSIGWRICR